MEASIVRAGVQSDTLRVEWVAGARGAQGEVVEADWSTTSDVAGQLVNLGWLVGLCHAVASQDEIKKRPIEHVDEFDPMLFKAEYGSPLVLLVELPRAIVLDVGAMALLIYGLKRLWTLPLEIRTHVEEKRALFLEAQRRAMEAEDRLKDAIENSGTRRAFKDVDRNEGWGDRTTSEIEKRRAAGRRWVGQEATWLSDE